MHLTTPCITRQWKVPFASVCGAVVAIDFLNSFTTGLPDQFEEKTLSAMEGDT